MQQSEPPCRGFLPYTCPMTGRCYHSFDEPFEWYSAVESSWGAKPPARPSSVAAPPPDAAENPFSKRPCLVGSVRPDAAPPSSGAVVSPSSASEISRGEEPLFQPSSSSSSSRGLNWLVQALNQFVAQGFSSMDATTLTSAVSDILKQSPDADQMQEPLLSLLGFDAIELMTQIIQKKDEILRDLLTEQLKGGNVTIYSETDMRLRKQLHKKAERSTGPSNPLQSDRSKDVFLPDVHLDGDMGAHMSIPEGSLVSSGSFYKQVVIPPIVAGASVQITPRSINDLPEYAQVAFPNVDYFNRLQSLVFDKAFFSDENLLICAPTGSGKTNVAALVILREISRNIVDGCLNRDAFKIIYIAPMKALAQEIVSKFVDQFSPLGINVKEYTGDSSLTKEEIATSQLFVMTPEKYDIVTRKLSAGDDFVGRVRLIILDEVHLLASDRGNVIESIVARTLRLAQSSQNPTRLLGLSATLPNYEEVGRFLRVDLKHGLFYCDDSFRPVPLTKVFVGLSDDKRRYESRLNSAAYAYMKESIQRGFPVMIFVHTRRGTQMTAEEMLALATRDNQQGLFSFDQSYSYLLRRVMNDDLRQLLQKGIGVHNAGLCKRDRNTVEELFRERAIQLICCTSTLAWGINMPARTVIIKGTDVYNPEKGKYTDLEMLDVLQIFGRAGRPQYDSLGIGIIISRKAAIDHYIKLLENTAPMVSKFCESLGEHLNAEVVSGTVTNFNDAVYWLSFTYFYYHLRAYPRCYIPNENEIAKDPSLSTFVQELLGQAITRLEGLQMVRYDPETGSLGSTLLGQVASHYYISCDSVELYNRNMAIMNTYEDILSVVSQSKEFRNLRERQEEELELVRMKSMCKIRLNVRGDTVYAEKANILIQAYISGYKPRVYTLSSDMYFIQQNASRIFRAIFEIGEKRSYWTMTNLSLELCKSLERTMWFDSLPLYQFPYLDRGLLSKLEGFDTSQLMDMEANEITSVLGPRGSGDSVKRCLDQLPFLHVDVRYLPLTNTVLRLNIVLNPQFEWNSEYHRQSLLFWVFVVDNSESIIHHSEQVILQRQDAESGRPTELTIHIPFPSDSNRQYYISVTPDRWIGVNQMIPINCSKIISPCDVNLSTNLMDLSPLPISTLKNPDYEQFYSFSHFNPLQTQIFYSAYQTDMNLLIGAPTGSGKTIIAELCLFRLLNNYPKAKAVYIGPLKALVRERVDDWRKSFGQSLHQTVVELTGDVLPDLDEIRQARIIVTTPEKWDAVARMWGRKLYVQEVNLVIIDEIHMLGSDRGPTIESIVSRMRQISESKQHPIRFVGLSTSIANCRDLGDWMGVPVQGLYNFSPNVRPIPVTVHISGYPGQFYCPRMETMNKPVFSSIKTYSDGKPVIVFVSSRRQTRLTALALIAFAAQENPQLFCKMEPEDYDTIARIKDDSLKQTLQFGIGQHHAGIDQSDRSIVEGLFHRQKIQILCSTSTLAWGINMPAHLVILKGTEFFDKKTCTYKDYPITDVLQMIGRAGRPQYDHDAVACVLVQESKKDFYKKFLYEFFPVESNIQKNFTDFLNAEIAIRYITSSDDCLSYLEWTYFYHRIVKNPTYYGISDNKTETLYIFLEQMVETSVNDLEMAGCITVNGNSLIPTRLGEIACEYYLKHTTVSMMNYQLSTDLTVPDLFKLLSFASEYDEMPVRHNEDITNQRLAAHMPWREQLRDVDFSDVHVKTFLLFQSYFLRIPFEVRDYANDTLTALDQASRIITAMIEISEMHNNLHNCVELITMLRMLVQCVIPPSDDLLLIPGVTPKVAEVLRSSGIRSLGDVLKHSESSLLSATHGGVDASLARTMFEGLTAYPRIEVHGKARVSSSPPSRPSNNPLEEDFPPLVTPSELIADVFVDMKNTLPYQFRSNGLNRNHPYSWWLFLVSPRDGILCSKKANNNRQVRASLRCPLPASGSPAGLQLRVLSDCFFGIDETISL